MLTQLDWIALRKQPPNTPEQFTDYLRKLGYGSERQIAELVSLFREYIVQQKPCPHGNFNLAW